MIAVSPDTRARRTIFLRAFAQVALVAWNVVNLSQQQYALAFVSGFGVSYVWWGNSRAAAHERVTYAREAYALGAAVGTVAGLAVGQWL